MLGGYACFGLIGAALFGVGVGMASEINAGWLEVKRASPMPPLAYLLAKSPLPLRSAGSSSACLSLWVLSFGGVSISALRDSEMLALSQPQDPIAFSSMGLLLAQVVPSNAAPGIVNLLYLPMSFASGLWIPLRQLPHWVRAVAPASAHLPPWPAYGQDLRPGIHGWRFCRRPLVRACRVHMSHARRKLGGL